MKYELHIRLLSQYFYPEQNATSAMLTGIAAQLSSLGHKVEVIAGQPSYRTSKSENGEAIYREILIRRVWSTRRPKSSPLGRISNTLTFTISVLLSQLKAPTPDITIAVSNPPTLHWICCLIHLFRPRAKYITLIHDLYPDIAVAENVLQHDSLITKAWRLLNKATFRRAAAIVALDEDMSHNLERYITRPATNMLSTISNWADGELIQPLAREGHPLLKNKDLNNKFVVLYSGNIGRFHEIDTILRSAEQLDSENRFVFLFYGDGAQAGKVRDVAKTLRNKTIRLQPFQAEAALPLTLTGCDASLVTLKTGASGLASPSKLYGALASGKPLLTIAPPESAAARVTVNENCGMWIQPGDVSGLTQALRFLRENPNTCECYGKRSRELYERHYSIQEVGSQWDDLLQEVAATNFVR